MAFATFLAFALCLPAQQSAPQQKAPEKAPGKAAAEKPAEKPAPAPAEPRDYRETPYIYDINGNRVPASAGSQQQRLGAGPDAPILREDLARGPEGLPVVVRKGEERVLSGQPDDRQSERVIQRYDPMGRPTTKEVIKTERKKMPDGTVETTDVLYNQDVNGQLQFVERRTTTEKKGDSGGYATTVVERPSINGGTRVVERDERTETKQGSVTNADSSRKFLDANGNYVEREREVSTATKSGDTTSSDSKKWQLGPTGQMDFVSQTIATTIQKPDGSQIEDAEVYTTKIAGTTPDLNHPNTPSLDAKIHKERQVQPDGKIVETTSERMRQVADPSRLSGLSVTKQITTPTVDGKTTQTTVSERDANGKLIPVRSQVEQETK
ncbi:MAG TPA: hypothetical protein VEU62_20425 [Bryobacterales bacterium]|nr:hypothetical protein [Bryobacterales bacterium]